MIQIVSRATIEREARAAARQGLSIEDACPYPFHTEHADHFKAVYLLALSHPIPTTTIPEKLKCPATPAAVR